MSFDWNLSSDEEEGFDNWGKSDTLGESWTNPVSNSINLDNVNESSSDEDDGERKKSHTTVPLVSEVHDVVDDEEEDDVDWEDAEENDNADSTTEKLATDIADAQAEAVPNPPTRELKPVTLSLTEDNQEDADNKPKAKKRVARKRYRFEQLTPDLQYLLANVEKAHLLCLTSHAMYVSKKCSSSEAVHIANSMIPLAWSSNSMMAPSEDDLSNFCRFFFNLVNPTRHQQHNGRGIARRTQRGHRRRMNTTKTAKHGVPDYRNIQYRLEQYCEQIRRIQQGGRQGEAYFNSHDVVQLFIAMVRSMGWRARYVSALDPCKKDLDVNHPIFVAMGTRNVFQRIWRESFAQAGGGKRPSKRAKTESKGTNLLSYDNPSLAHHGEQEQGQVFSWVEVLCQQQGEDGKTGKVPAKQRRAKEKPGMHWVHVDPVMEVVNMPATVETTLYAIKQGLPSSKVRNKKYPIGYALAAEHVTLPSTDDTNIKLRLTDVTPRYASSYVDSLVSRGVIRGKRQLVDEKDRVDKWWDRTLKAVNMANGTTSKSHARSEKKSAEMVASTSQSHAAVDPALPMQHPDLEEIDALEKKQLQASKDNEPIPTSKTAFKSHSVYTLPSLLLSNQVLKPDAKKRMCGVFKGEFVYRRTDVETALVEKKWLYQGRKVREDELHRPIKRVKGRSTAASKNFKALKSYGVGTGNDGSEEARAQIVEAASQPLDEGMQRLYASWQTEPWSPSPVGPQDAIPVNEHKNVELELLNPGLVHIAEPFVSKVAKKLGIPYAPCLLGFEGHGGNRTPVIRGIVVHEHNAELLREANAELSSHLLEEEHENRQRTTLLRWKRLLVGVLTKDRLERTYGDS